jgi:hypothetical protein
MLEVLNDSFAGMREYRHRGILDRARLTVTYRVDEAEQESRLERGLGSVEDEFLLAALMTLPTDGLREVDPRFTRVLHSPRAASVATVIDDPDGGTWAQRRLGVPLEVEQIEIEASSWSRGIAAAHQWAGYARRCVRARGPLNAFTLTEATHYGIGVIAEDGACVVAPGAYSPQRWSSARWRLAEMVYGQFRELSS